MDGARSARIVSLAVAVCAALACRNTAAPAGASGGAGTSGVAGAAAGTTGAAGAGPGSDAAAGAPPGNSAVDGGVVPAVDGPTKLIVLSIGPADGMPLVGIASFAVTVMNNGSSRALTFTNDGNMPLATAPLKLGVMVEPSESGAVVIIVDALAANGCTLATALINVVLVEDAVIYAAVALQRLDECAADDGGAPDAPAAPDGGPVRFPGCDPVKTACGNDMTCEVRCAAKAAACTAGGSGFHGTTCASSADCAAGSECVDYAAAGCAVKICRRFCAEDVNCPQPISAALPRNACAVPLACGGSATAYRTCSVSCDPTFATRANGDSSCPDHLDCLLLDPDHADCACSPRANGKGEGQTCDVTDDCALGLVCNLMGATKTCRAICRCNVEDGACAAVVDGACPKAGTHCAPLTGGTVFGVCVP